MNTMSTKNIFSILIPTWNNLSYLKTCIESIRKNSTFSHQIIVHVNEGADGTIDWLQQENIEFTQSEKNIGICFAVNQSAALATADYILYINDDMYVLPDWDKNLMNKINAIGHSDFMMSATMIEPKDTGNPIVVCKNYGTDLATFEEAKIIAEYKTLAISDWNGSSWPPVLMPKSWWLKIGGFSSEFSPGMYSDPDLAMKMWHAGCRIFIGVGNAFVYHFQAKSTGRVVKNDGRKMFKQKWTISANFFYKNYLKMGTPNTGKLPDYESNIKLALEKLRNKF